MQFGFVRTLFFQKTLDHLFSIALILVLTLLALQSYRVTGDIVQVCASVASVNDLRLDVQYHYALTGEWPKDLESILRSRPAEVAYKAFGENEVSVDDGAIHIKVKGHRLGGETISVHPAVLSDNVTGVVSWVVGPGVPQEGRIIQGPDATTVDSTLILRDWH